MVLNLSKSVVTFVSASLSLVGDNSLVNELRVIAAVELHVNATYATYALKSVYEKSQSVMDVKLLRWCIWGSFNDIGSAVLRF